MRLTKLLVVVSIMSVYMFAMVVLFFSICPYLREDDVRIYVNRPTLEEATDNITREDRKPAIFFIDTNLNFFNYQFNSYTPVTLHRRDACAVESAAKHNPKRKVYFLVISPGVIPDDNDGISKRIFDALLSYKNVGIFYMNIDKYVQGTPVGVTKYWKFGPEFAMDRSMLLRLATVWTYGGICLDLDLITLKSLDGLGDNFLGAVTRRELGTKIFGFAPDGAGHALINQFAEEFFALYKWSNAASRGSGPWEKYALSVCGYDKLRDIINTTCEDLTIYPPSHFFPVPNADWAKYFDESPSEDLLRRLKKSYTMCTWGTHSWNTSLPVNSTSAYLRVARKSCPRVLDACDDYF